MLRQHTPKMWRPPHASEHVLLWFGLGALVIVAAVATVWFVLPPRVEAPPPAAVPKAAANPNVPISGTGLAYDGWHYGKFVMPK